MIAKLPRNLKKILMILMYTKRCWSQFVIKISLISTQQKNILCLRTDVSTNCFNRHIDYIFNGYKIRNIHALIQSVPVALVFNYNIMPTN